MFCPKCGEKSGKHGKTRDGQQRYRCAPCRMTYSEPKALIGIATPVEKACQALSMLLEGMSVRATARLTGLDKNTVLRVMVQAGEQCWHFLADQMQDVEVHSIQVDEVWSFVGAKERTAFAKNLPTDCGDAYVFTAVDRETKLLVCHHVGRRTGEDAEWFARKLAARVNGKPHISTDGFRPYCTAIPQAFGHDVNHGMVVKQYGRPNESDRRRYSPANIIGVKVVQNSGHSRNGQASTSHVERSNLTVRMQNRRFTRLTNAFSKKWENHERMFCLFSAWYNFVRKHQTLKTTPAVAAGIASEPWTLERMLSESAKAMTA